MSDHKHGEMDTKVQESTFDGFIKFGTWSCVVVLAILVFMAVLHRNGVKPIAIWAAGF